MACSWTYWLFLAHVILLCAISASGDLEARALLKFKESLSNYTHALSNWNESISLCSGNGGIFWGSKKCLCTRNIYSIFFPAIFEFVYIYQSPLQGFTLTLSCMEVFS